MKIGSREMRIETPRLLLRPLVEADLDALARINADPEVARYLGSGNTLSRADTWRQIAISIGHGQLRGYSMLAIEERSSGAFLGRTGPWFPEGWPMLEVGWVVDPRRQGEGFATEAGRAVARLVLRQPGRAGSLQPNPPGQRGLGPRGAKLGAMLDHTIDDLLGLPADLWLHRRSR